MANNRFVWASRIVFALAILLLLAHFALYVYYAVGLMSFPFDYDQGEGFELVDTVLFSEGEWPYRNNEVYPFYASNYPPLFHVILVPFAWVFGPAHWYGRLVGFLGTLVTAAAIGIIVWREGRHRPLAVMSGLAFLASNYVYHVGPLFRQHMTMVMFETLAALTLAHVTEIDDPRRRRKMIIVGLVLLLAAGYTKQLALATCAAVFGFLFIRNPRRAVIWGLIFALAAGVIFVWMNRATGGEWWANIIAANVNTYFPQQFIDLFKQWFRLHSVLILMAGLMFIYELYFARLSLYSIWWVLAILNSGLSGKWGAGDSYFATAIAASCVLAGIWAARTVRGAWTFPDNYLARALAPVLTLSQSRRGILLALAGLVIPMLYLYYGLNVIKLPTEGRVFGPLAEALGLESSYGERYAFYDSAGWVQGYATIGHVPSQTDRDNGWRIVDMVRESDLPVLSEEAGFSLRADKDVITNPTQLKNLYENDLFDPTHLVNAIRAHDFGLIIFRAQFYPPPVLDAAYEAYYPDAVIVMNGFNYEIWRPGPPQPERETFAAGLDTFAPGDSWSQTITLPPEKAARWLAHALNRRGWVPGEELPAGENGCFTRRFQQGQQVIQAEGCPVESGTTITLSGEDA